MLRRYVLSGRRTLSRGILSLLLAVLLAVGSLPGGTALAAPAITGVDPPNGPVAGGTSVVITGSGFDLIGVTVTFGGTPASVVNVETTGRITAKTPAAAVPGPVDVTVTNSDGSKYTVINGFTYISAPLITEVAAPRTGSTVGGDLITILGANFMVGAGVFIGNNQASGVQVNAAGDQITAVTPPGTVGAKSVKVVNPDGGQFVLSDTSANTFSYVLSTPAITGFSPLKGSVLGGTPISILGDQFGSGATVRIGDNYATGVQVVSVNRIDAVTPPGTLGFAAITVANPDVQSAVYGAGPGQTGYEYIITPTISSITPNFGSVVGGAQVVIRGTNFSTTNGVTVLFGGIPAAVGTLEAQRLVVTAPPGPLGSVDVIVINKTSSGADSQYERASVRDGFTYVETMSQPKIAAAPGVDPVSPNTGTTDGGTPITILGQDFLTGARVFIGSAEATSVTVVNTGQITAVTPPNSVGPKNVRVLNPDGGEAILQDGFTYKTPESVLMVTSITPNEGTVEGGTPITLNGVNFKMPDAVGNPKVEVEVTIGGNQISNLVVGADLRTITGITPGGYIEPGQLRTSHDVIMTIRTTLTNPDLTVTRTIERSVLTGGFTYVIPPSRPVVSSVVNTDTNNAEGPVAGGSPVLITGTDFRSGARVYFGGAESPSVTVVSSTEIRVVTPPGQATGMVDVRVVNFDGGTFTLKGGFYYRGNTIQLYSVTPSRGTVRGGTIITISGANFNVDLMQYTSVKIGAEPAVIQSMTDTKIVAVTPRNTEGPQDVTVSNRFGQTTLDKGFTYQKDISAPAVTGISLIADNTPVPRVSGGAAGGTGIRLYGSDFRAGADAYIGGTKATSVDILSDTMATAVTAPGTPGIFDVALVNPDGGTGLLAGGFQYISVPVIETISPNQASVRGGGIATITGRNFMTGAGVQFIDAGGPVQAPEVYVVDDRTLRVRAPAAVAGVKDVRATNPDGGTYLATSVFVFRDPALQPSIVAVTPSRGSTAGGTGVTIAGANFAPDALVWFGWGQAQSPTISADGTTITVNAPANSAGLVDVTVINADDTGAAVASRAFEYVEPTSKPVLTAVIPNFGGNAGGDYVTVTGGDFRAGAELYFGGRLAQIVELTETRIIARTPQGATLGPVDVLLINPDTAPAKLPSAFTYKKPDSLPGITGVSPSAGTMLGGTDVTITGFDFREGITVYVGGVRAANVALVAGDTLRARTPPGPAGFANVTVVNEDGGSATLVRGFEYRVPESEPRILTVEPAEGPEVGGTATTITGRDFRDGLTVSIGGVPALNVRRVDYKTITAVTPPGTAGPKDVAVTNPDTGTVILPNGFTYRTPPSKIKIDRIVPNVGPIAGGTRFTIFGVDFQAGTRVTIGTAAATGIEVVDASTINAITPPSEDGKVGPKDVTITSPDGTQTVAAGGFTYKLPDSAPTIDRVDPDKGTVDGGTEIVVVGTDFREGVEVYLGGLPATDVALVNGTLIKAKTAKHAEGFAGVTVVNEDGGTATLLRGFEYRVPLSAPAITAVTPAEGPAAGGTAITISGRDFRPGIEVYVGGTRATGVVRPDYKTVTAVTPPGGPGSVDVTVVNTIYGDVARATLPNGFKYLSEPPRAAPGQPTGVGAWAVKKRVIKVYWNKVNYTNYYEVYISTDDDGPFQFAGRTSETTWYAADLSSSTTYWFKVRAVNELGYSAFGGPASETTSSSADDESRGLEIPDVKYSQAGGEASLAVATEDALRRLDRRLYLGGQEWNRYERKKVSLGARVLEDAGGSVTIDFGDLELWVELKGLYAPALRDLSSSEIGDAWARVGYRRVAGAELESALRAVPQGFTPMSPVIDLSFDALVVKKITPSPYFYREASVGIEYDIEKYYSGQFYRTIKGFYVYRFNPETRKWEDLGGGRFYSQTVRVETSQPGRYVLLAR